MRFRRPHRSLVIATLTCAAILVACEMVLHIDAVRESLPAANLYYDTEVETRLERLATLSRKEARLDLLFVGSSIVRTNVAPLVFDAQVSQLNDAPFVSFNGGLSGLGLDAVQVYLRNFWLTRTHPAVVVQGVRFSELNAAPPAASQAVYRGQIERHWIDGDDPWRLQEAALRQIHLLHYRGEFMETLRHLQKGASVGSLNRRYDYPVDERGHGPSRNTLADFRTSPKFHPAILAVSDPLAAADFTAGLASLAASHEACKAAGTSYVVVNVPDHADRYASPAAAQQYRQYLDILSRFCRKRQIPFVDMTDGDPAKYTNDFHFADFDHLNDQGAAEFTVQLARRLAPLLPGAPSTVTSTR